MVSFPLTYIGCDVFAQVHDFLTIIKHCFAYFMSFSAKLINLRNADIYFICPFETEKCS